MGHFFGRQLTYEKLTTVICIVSKIQNCGKHTKATYKFVAYIPLLAIELKSIHIWMMKNNRPSVDVTLHSREEELDSAFNVDHKLDYHWE